MAGFFSGSAIIGFFRRMVNKLNTTAGQSLLLAPRAQNAAMASSELAGAFDRVHPVEGALKQVSRSRILGWLYRYWGNLCALPLGKGTLGGWLGGSFLVRHCNIPQGKPLPSVYIYLVLCALLGGGVGWVAGPVYGVAAAVAAALTPAVFAVPPVAMLCLLLGLLPLCSTGICWALSAATVVVYFFARAFGGHAGKKIDALDLLFMVFPLLCVASAVFSFDRADSIKVVAMWMGLFLCVPFVRRIITTRKHLMAALTSLTVGAACSGLYGLFQYFSGMVDTTWTDTALFEDLQLRVYSTFANPNVYGEFLLLTIPLAAGLALYFKGGKRWLLWGVDLLLAANMVLTYSRGCYVGIALTAVVFLWNYSKKWLAAIAAVGVPLAIAVMPASVMSRILSIGNMSDTSTSYRMMIYIGTLLMFSRYWFSGVGIGEGAYNIIYPYYALSGIIAPHSHSLFFQSVVSFGIVGLLYLIVLWTVYQRRIKGAQAHLCRRDRLLTTGFNAVMWGMLVQSIFDYTWYNYRVFQLFWLVLALGFAATQVLRRKEND